jgi:type IV secretion system protein VirD4
MKEIKRGRYFMDINSLQFLILYLSQNKKNKINDLLILYIYCKDLINNPKSELNNDTIPKILLMDLHEDSGFFIGMKSDKKGYAGKPAHMDGHILTIGFPGSGKTMAIVIPTMMTWRGSKIIIDVKGNLYSYWKIFYKNTGRKVLVFSPGTPENNNCYYDPFLFLRHDGTDNLTGNARDLALTLIPLVESGIDQIWTKAAQNFLTAAIIYHFDLGSSFNDMMIDIQLSDITQIIDRIMKSNNTKAKIYVSKFSNVSKKVILSLGLDLNQLATFASDLAILNAFLPFGEKCLLDWSELNKATEPMDIILEIPEANLERWEPMIKLMINQLIKTLERRAERTYNNKSELPPILIMLDEFSRLGKLTTIKNGLATLRSRGVTFALFVQSIAVLDELYGAETARVIADLFLYKILLGVSDPISQEYFTKAVGTINSIQKGVSMNIDPFSEIIAGYSQNINETREPIFYPNEYLTLEDIVVINPHNGICRVEKIMFHENETLFLKQRFLDIQENVEATLLLTYKGCETEGGNKNE